MQLSCGIDIIEISRIKKAMQNSTFLQKHYTALERDYIASKGVGGVQSAAAFFAAKEAFAKALGSGVRGFSLCEVGVNHHPNGQPYLDFFGQAAELVSESGLQFALSLSHSREYAVANVTAWKE